MINEQALLLNPKLAAVPEGKEKLWIKSREVPGLYLEVRATGKRSWFAYLLRGGKQIRKRLADADLCSYGEAKKLFRQWVSQTASSVKPSYSAQGLMTVGDAFLCYFNKHVILNNARPNEIKAGFARYWGSIGDLLVIDLTKAVISDWMAEIALEFGKETANKQLNTLRACVNFVIDEDLVELGRNPFKKVKRFKSLPPQIYLKKGPDCEKILELLDKCTSEASEIIKLLLWCGQRKGNVLAMRWSDIDLHARCWTIQSVSHKTRKVHYAALSDKAIQILSKREKTSEFVFPSAKSKTGHRVSLERIWYRVREEAGLPNLTLHMLRHTVGTWMGQSNANSFLIQKALGHSNAATALRYTHMNVDDVLIELERSQLGL